MTQPVVIGDATLYLGDCMELMSVMPAFDAVVTDPPYMMGSAATRAGKGFRSKVGDWTNAAYWYAAWMRECWGRLPQHGSMWMCGNWRTMPVLTVAADSFGAAPSSVIVWDKDWIGVGSLKGMRQRYELVFQFGKEGFTVQDRAAPDIWVCPWSSQRPSGHESEKPVSLMRRAVDYSIGPVIFDPFMGSGTTGVSAIQAGRKFVGVEVEQNYFDIACKRIEEAHKQRRLFVEAKPQATQEQMGLEDADV